MKPRTIMAAVLAACLVFTAAPAAQADIIWAGDGFVELDAAGLPAGDLLFWENTGTLAETDPLTAMFIYESADGVLPLVEMIDSAQAVTFTGSNLFTGPNAPAGLTGLDPTRSIEVWAYNPFIASEETLVAWGKRGGGDGTNMSFNYGNHSAYGSVGHWGGPDLGWDATPTAKEWHHLVYTYDGTTTRVYADGELKAEEALGAGVINTHADSPIRIGSQTEADGIVATGGLRASLSLGRVRIHDGVLSLDDIVNNYDEERPEFPLPEPPEPAVPEPLETPPIHRWSFEEEGLAGTELVDSIGGAHGTIVDLGLNDGSVGGGQVTLAGGLKDDSDYVSFPEGILGETEDLTIETWATQHGIQNWSRIFDFGIDNTNYVFMSWTMGEDLNADRAGINLGPETSMDNMMAPYTLDEEFHITMTLDGSYEDTGNTLISVYRDGELQGELLSVHSPLGINDVNNWLGRSQYGDNTANASWDEFRIYDYALSANEVLGNFEAGAAVINLATASQLTWDEAGGGAWGDLRWLDGEGAAADFIPDDGIDATIKTDVVLVDVDAAANVVTVESGALVVASGATLATTATTVAAGATLEVNDATITGNVEVSGVLGNGGDASTSTLGANLTLADGSTLVLGATGTGVGSVVVNGDATISPNSSLVIQFGGGEANLFKAGTYTLIDNQGENGLLGAFGAVTDLGDYATAGEAEDGLLYDPAGVTLVIEKDLHPGDINLDTITDLSDFNEWNKNKFLSGTDWTAGDVNGDGITDLSDFNEWNKYKFTQAAGGAAPAPTQVPEPGTLALLACGLFGLLLAWRRRTA